MSLVLLNVIGEPPRQGGEGMRVALNWQATPENGGA
jgi:hypothetical protein